MVPIQAILTLAAAQGIATLGRGVDPRPAWLLLAPLVALGLLPALGDWRYDRDPSDLWHHMPPHQYSGAFGPGRGPPLAVHLACTDPDPESRAGHIEAVGRFLMPSPRRDPGLRPLVDSLRDLEAAGTWSADEIAGLVSSLGGHAAREYQGGALSFAEMTHAAFETAEELGPGVGDNYLLGLRRSLGDAKLEIDPADLVEGLCRASPSGTRPLCALAGERLVRVDAEEGWPSRPEDLFEPGFPEFSALPRSTRDALLFGAAVRLTRAAAGRALPAAGPAGWDAADAEVFVVKWRVKGGKVVP